MKQLTCEMCGSTDLMKQDGVFVCQTCGTKYSVEEAKKMMVEGTVDVTGSTVKVDTSGELDNLYLLARRAKTNNNILKPKNIMEKFSNKTRIVGKQISAQFIMLPQTVRLDKLSQRPNRWNAT